jgi:hypothetical protein
MNQPDDKNQSEGVPLESLDSDTLAAIERAEAQSARGEGRPWEEVHAQLEAKYLTGGNPVGSAPPNSSSVRTRRIPPRSGGF